MKKTLLLSLCISFLFFSCSQTYYVVRHAEKQGGKDPELTEQGKARAENLKNLLQEKGVTHIYSSEYKRTLATVAPLAQAIGVEIKFYNPANQDNFIESLKTLNGNTIISGHSNTIRYVINGLNEKEVMPADLEDHEYGDLFVIKRRRFGKGGSFKREQF